MQDAEPSTPKYLLFDPFALPGITFFGGPLAASLAFAINFHRVGNKRAAWISIILGVVATVAIIALGFALPENTPHLILPVPQVVLSTVLAYKLLKAPFDKHLSNGGARVKWWTTLGVVIAGLGITIGGALTAAICTSESAQLLFEPHLSPTAVTTVYYSGSVKKEQAEALGKALKELGYFNDKTESVVRLTRTADGPATIMFVCSEVGWKDPKIRLEFEEMVRMIAPLVGGFPVNVKLADGDLTTHKEFEVDE